MTSLKLQFNMILEKKVPPTQILILIILLTGILGCTFSHQDKSVLENSNQGRAKDTIPFSGIVYLLPSPYEVLLTTFNEDIVFNQGLTAPFDIEKRAVISHHKAFILGVYITDLSYRLIFKDYPNGLKNINSIRNLSQDLGINTLVDNTYFLRIENNINRIDSIDAIFNDFIQNSFNSIEQTGNNELLSFIAMGAGIEAMFLTYKSTNFKIINKTVLPNFFGQRVIYENYYKNFVAYNQDKEEMKDFIHDISIIFTLFEKNIAKITETRVSKIKDAHFNIDEITTFTFDESAVNRLGDSIAIVRSNLINLKYQ